MTRQMTASLLVASAIMLMAAGGSRAASQFWVVGNLVTNSCDIVSQSPVVSPAGPVWFGNGPHKSYDDAKMARNGISACPRVD